MPRSYPPEFRRKVLDLIASGRKVAEVAQLLGISDQTIYAWRRQDLIGTGQLPGTISSELPELAAARKRIAELEAESAVHRRAAEVLGEVTSSKGDERVGQGNVPGQVQGDEKYLPLSADEPEQGRCRAVLPGQNQDRRQPGRGVPAEPAAATVAVL